ncbi:hypothetical protein CYLTODRAFT_415645 [Cylindrobasidium torrendii FP15055 ss-10]|uniref:Uncharacterized protein n=1 Tax=Cylindrobasidium torrendii FP15055 ss-10 TaxID=1314674 RepID=A0A0D7AS03_9AGAR|nr:hypothetical protein CYLTODRAFT_415645 [Cylindrobasidium torrendii FP15055 ss-10]
MYEHPENTEIHLTPEDGIVNESKGLPTVRKARFDGLMAKAASQLVTSNFAWDTILLDANYEERSVLLCQGWIPEGYVRIDYEAQKRRRERAARGMILRKSLSEQIHRAILSGEYVPTWLYAAAQILDPRAPAVLRVGRPTLKCSPKPMTRDKRKNKKSGSGRKQSNRGREGKQA